MCAPFRRLLDPFRRPARTAARLACAVALAAGVLGASGGGGLAQDTQTQSLIDRIDRLQRELSDLQRNVYRGEPPPTPPAGAPAQSGGLTTTAAARIELRLSQFEAELRALTGQVEEAVYRNSQLRERLDRLAADMDLRLQRLEQASPATAAAPGAQAGRPAAPAGGEPSSSGDQPRALGTINQADLEALQRQQVESASSAAQAGAAQGPAQPPGAQQAAAPDYPLAGETAEEQYQHAFGLLSQANYGEAERALRSFIARHPDDALAGNAKYWLGETYYVRQDYQQAAVTFAEAYQEYPDSAKAPDNLLKLGMSLSALGSTSDACGTFAELLKRYPEAAATVTQRAQQERQRLACP